MSLKQTARTSPSATAQLIANFMGSIQEVLATMASITVKVGTPTLKTDPAPSYDVSGIIGFSGDFVGSMVLSFHQQTAAKIILGFTGSEIAPDSPDFADAIGELANMIAGSAKKAFTGNTSITVPSVIIGSGHVLARFHDMPCIIIPCESAAGAFAVEVSIKARQADPKPVKE